MNKFNQYLALSWLIVMVNGQMQHNIINIPKTRQFLAAVRTNVFVIMPNPRTIYWGKVVNQHSTALHYR
jgi:hypothetical protein